MLLTVFLAATLWLVDAQPRVAKAQPGADGPTVWLQRKDHGAPVSLVRRPFGRPSDLPLAGDWDGDGRDTVGVRRGIAFLLSNRTRGLRAEIGFRFGRPGDVPLVGDWDGDARDTVGVRRGNVFILSDRPVSRRVWRVAFGRATDVPLVGDWDGDGRDTVGVRRGRTFLLADHPRRPVVKHRLRLGLSGDVPLAGDWDGDGRDTVGVRRGRQLVLADSGGRAARLRYLFGRSTDTPLTGDHDGDGVDSVWLQRSPGFRARVSSLPSRVRDRMRGRSWRPGCPVGLEALALVSVRHWGFDGGVHQGRLVARASEARRLARVFSDLFAARFPLARVELVDAFDADDNRSMTANNTSAFNCRRVAGSRSWSEHSYGTALDLNPVQNPYVRGSTVSPPAGRRFLDRRNVRAGMVTAGDVVTAAFARAGWSWGGNWRTLKDYQHFSASGR